MTTYTTTYAKIRQERAQATYDAAIRAAGVAALLTPYRGADLTIPTQRTQSAAPVV